MIWLIGANGMLGRQVGELLTENNFYWTGSSGEVDIANPKAIENFITSTETSMYLDSHQKFDDPTERKIKWIINCAAYTAVDKAEEETEKAEAVNATGALNIARAARNHGAKLIHISTDYVFDGNATLPYKETDAKNPMSVYGKTKAAGEDAIASAMTQYYILRTSWLYGFYGKNFVYTITNLLNSKDEINVVNDQFGSPTFCGDLANVILMIIEKSLKATTIFGKNSAPAFGIYHFTNEGKTNWCDFANKIAEFGKKFGKVNNSCKINGLSTDEYYGNSGDDKKIAPRPKYSVLSKAKIEKELHIKIPTWEQSLKIFMSDKRFGGE